MNRREELTREASRLLQYLHLPKLRGVATDWIDNTAVIRFYFDGEPSEEDQEEASCICGEIIARFADGFLQEDYLRLDAPKPLPKNRNWVFLREE